MRYGLLSDVHANLPALLAVLGAFRQREIDTYVCAGDVVGYGPHPAECIAAVDALKAAWILGNHELMLLGRLPRDRAGPLARRTIEWTRAVLPGHTLRRLDRLPLTAELEGGVIVAHGSLNDPSLRITRHPQMVSELDQLGQQHPQAWLLVLGHTHRVFVANSRTELRWAGLRPRVRLTADTRYIVNPGSVGQSRGYLGGARAAVLDTATRTLELLAVRYDTSSLENDLTAVGFPKWAHHRSPFRRLAERIERKARKVLGPDRPGPRDARSYPHDSGGGLPASASPDGSRDHRGDLPAAPP